MRVYIVGSSALFYWRNAYDGGQELDDVVRDHLTDCVSSAHDLRGISLNCNHFGHAPIRLMVPNGRLRPLCNNYAYTVESRKLPLNSFRKVSEHICVASPEFCVVQAAKILSLPQLLELCMELCGTYSLDKATNRGFATRDYQLMTSDSLRDFVARYNRNPLNRRIGPWLRFIAEGSHSPMETREYLLMCLPKRLGGYGLPLPALNYQIKLDSEEQRISGRGFFLCDMCWPHQKVVVEYDGQEDHASAKDRAADATRQNILVSKGYTVFVITSRQIYHAQEFDRIIHDIARYLGYRLKNFPCNWANRRDYLRKELFRSIRHCS